MDLAGEASQMARVAAAVPRWLASVPLYSRLLPFGCDAAAASFSHCFRQLPIISKREIREEFPHNFLPQGVDLQGLIDRDLIELERTSGTSEEPTPLLLARGWWEEQEQKALRLNRWVAQNLPDQAQRVTLVSPFCNSDICYTGTPALSDRILGQNLFVNLSRHPFLWSEASLARMAAETSDWAPLFLDVDPVYGVCFARYCERWHIRFPSLKFIISSYEFLSQTHRAILRRVFGVPVLNLYGSTETGHLLMENERGEMEASLDTAFLELVHLDNAGIGELVVTTLSNHYMPLIRYGIGDLARRPRPLNPNLFELHGRSRDAIRSSRGDRVTVAQVDQCFAGLEGIAHYHLRQETPADFTLYYVPEEDKLTGSSLADLQARLGDKLASKETLKLRAQDFIPCENSGKFTLCARVY